MSHLSRWLSALVDGELDPAERDRVLNHLAGCEPCLREANEMRALKRRLTALSDACDDGAIATRLIGLAQHEPGSFALSAFSAARWPDERPRSSRLARRLIRAGQFDHGWTVAAGSATTALAAFCLAAFLLGSTAASPGVPKVTPSVDSYVLQHAYDAGQAPAKPGSGNSLLRQGQVAPYPGAPGSVPGTAPNIRLRNTTGIPLSPGPVTSAIASPTASTPAPVDQSPGKQSGPYRAP